MPGPALASPERRFPPLQFGSGENEESARFSDYEYVGRKIVEWAQNGPDSWPKNIDELRAALDGHMTIPDVFKRLTITQGDDDREADYELVLRLPPRGQVTESERIVQSDETGEPYPLPPLYTGFQPGAPDENRQAINALRYFYARVADYTMRGCR